MLPSTGEGDVSRFGVPLFVAEDTGASGSGCDAPLEIKVMRDEGHENGLVTWNGKSPEEVSGHMDFQVSGFMEQNLTEASQTLLARIIDSTARATVHRKSPWRF